MEMKLKRTTLDKVGSMLGVLGGILFYIVSAEDYESFGKSVILFLCVALLVNAIFVTFTPILKINNNKLYLYAEVQPILFSLKPQILDIKQITKLEVSRATFEYRALFTLRHGKTVVHGFPATRNERVVNFLQFLKDNTESPVVEAAYNKALKQGATHGSA